MDYGLGRRRVNACEYVRLGIFRGLGQVICIPRWEEICAEDGNGEPRIVVGIEDWDVNCAQV